LEATAEREQNVQDFQHQAPDAALVLIPLVDCDAFRDWCERTEDGLDPNSAGTRARWAAEEIHHATDYTGEFPIIRGFHRYKVSGDLTAISLALATGWDGRSVAYESGEPPAQGWSHALTGLDLIERDIDVYLNMQSLPARLLWCHLRLWIDLNGGTIQDHLAEPGTMDRAWHYESVVLRTP
jgi:hypothetical protein